MKIKYEADDGRLFDSADAAKAHEEMLAFQPLFGLDEARLMAALRRDPDALDIADALEKAGARVAKQRREAGELKRERRAKGEAEAPQGDDDAPLAPLSAEELAEALGTVPFGPAASEDRTEGLPL